MAPAPQPHFQKDEKVLCFHMELLYEAKVMDVRQDDPTDKKSPFSYLIHYKGWKSTWDEWTPQDRLRKSTDENRELATNLRKEMEALRSRDRAAKAAPSSSKKRAADSEEPSVTTGRKRGRDHEVEKEETFHARSAVRIPIPDRLKSILVDDWENVTKNQQLVKLRAASTVDAILNAYIAYVSDKKNDRHGHQQPSELLEEVIHGIKEYFNKALGRVLLYRYERPQYLEVYSKLEDSTSEYAGKQMSDIYGGSHLLRLLVSLPELLAQTNMDQQSINRLRAELGLITSWMSQEQTVQRYLICEYENQDGDYKDKANVPITQQK